MASPGLGDILACIALGAWIGLSVFLRRALFPPAKETQMLIDGLPDYERMMSRSLALWKEFLTEILNSDDPRLASESIKLQRLLTCIQEMRVGLPVDPGPLKPNDLWKELFQELDFLHKRIIHPMPEREFAHRKVRVIEQLLRDIQNNGTPSHSPQFPGVPSK